MKRTLHIGRTLPPAAVPIGWSDLLNGLRGWVRGMEETERLRRELRDYFGATHCFLVSSGTAALFVILETLRAFAPGRREVIVPAFTCYSVPSAIVRAGLTVRPCDVNPETLDFDYEDLERILRPKAGSGSGADAAPLAVVPTHLFGIPSDVAKVRRLVTDLSVTIVEDAAQAMGACNSEGRYLGRLADVGFFSLGRGKAFSTVEGGVILTSRGDLADGIARRLATLGESTGRHQARLLAYALALCCFQHPSAFWFPRTLPFLHLGETIFDPKFPIRPYTPFQAGLARHWQPRLAALQTMRQRSVDDWRGHLPVHRQPILPPSPLTGNLIRLPLRLDPYARQQLLADTRSAALGIMPAYPDAIDRVPELKVHLRGLPCPKAGDLARQLVTLPVHAAVQTRDRQRAALLLKTCQTPVPP